MATRTVTASVTLHVPGPSFLPFEYNDAGIALKGKYDITEVPPGTPVKLDADEADALIARGVAEDYVAPSVAKASKDQPPPPT